MNDWEAMEAVNTAMEAFIIGETTAATALIARITGENKHDHERAQP